MLLERVPSAAGHQATCLVPRLSSKPLGESQDLSKILQAIGKHTISALRAKSGQAHATVPPMAERISVTAAIERAREHATPWFLTAALNGLTWVTTRLFAFNQASLIIGMLASVVLTVVMLVFWHRRSDEWRREVGGASMFALGLWGAFLAAKPDGYVARYIKNETIATSYHELRDSLFGNPPAKPETVTVHETRPIPVSTDPLASVQGSWPLRYQPPMNGFKTFEIPSYSETIDNLPNGQEWFMFTDGYRMLVEDRLTGQESIQRDGGDGITTRWGTYADYRHKSGSTSITVIRIRDQPDRPRK